MNSGTPGLRSIITARRIPICLMEENTVAILSEGGGTANWDDIKEIEEMLPSIFIVSQVEVAEGSEGVAVKVEHARGAKCERCWNWSETVGQDSRFPTIDARCVGQLKEGWGL